MRWLAAAIVGVSVTVPGTSWYLDWEPLAKRLAQVEDRLVKLELAWAEHGAEYHFTCEYEDCLTVDELLKWRRE